MEMRAEGVFIPREKPKSETREKKNIAHAVDEALRSEREAELKKKYPWLESEEEFDRDGRGNNDERRIDPLLAKESGELIPDRVVEYGERVELEDNIAYMTGEIADEDVKIPDPLPLRRFMATHPQNEYVIGWYAGMPHEDLVLERAKIAAQYEELRRAVAAYVPDKQELQFPEASDIAQMTDRQIMEFAEKLAKQDFLGAVVAPFTVYANQLQELVPVMKQDVNGASNAPVEHTGDHSEIAAK